MNRQVSVNVSTRRMDLLLIVVLICGKITNVEDHRFDCVTDRVEGRRSIVRAENGLPARVW